MIVSPDKGLFFVVTAVMCSAALYAAEISSPSQDPLRRVFIGVPNQLTLPPDSSEATAVSVAVDGCDMAGTNTAFEAGACTTKEKPAQAAIVLPGPLTGVSAAGQEHEAPASLSTAVQAH